MILVDVTFPELDKTIDFQLEENACGWDIAEELATMAASSCGRRFEPEAVPVYLYSADRQKPLDLNKSLRENGILSGERLLFI